MKLKLFGGVHLSLDCGQSVPLQTHRARALCAFLAVHPGMMIHREILCAKLWPDTIEARARAQLRKTLWRLRSALEPHSKNCPLQIEDHQIGLFPDGLWSDCWQFLEGISELELKPDTALTRQDAQTLIEATELHIGEFAAGIYDDWCRDAQQSFARRKLTAMERLFTYHQQRQQWIQAIDWAERILEIDNLREHLHRAIMACHMSMGDRASALRRYDICKEILSHELGVPPMAETKLLRDAIVAGRNETPVAPRSPKSDAAVTRKLLNQTDDLDRAITALGTAQRSLTKMRNSIGLETIA